MGSLHFTITWYKNRHAGEQSAHWDLYNKRILNVVKSRYSVNVVNLQIIKGSLISDKTKTSEELTLMFYFGK